MLWENTFQMLTVQLLLSWAEVLDKKKPWMPHVAQALGSTLLAKWRVLKEVT